MCITHCLFVQKLCFIDPANKAINGLIDPSAGVSHKGARRRQTYMQNKYLLHMTCSVLGTNYVVMLDSMLQPFSLLIYNMWVRQY